MNSVYSHARKFKKKYPFTVAWRLKQHSKVIQEHLNPGETVKYAFACQKGPHSYLMSSYVIAVTDRRLLLATKRLLFGYFYYSITPDMYNDLQVRMGLLWGHAVIDTAKEEITLTHLSKKALQEIETVITDFMINEKKLYKILEDKANKSKK